MAHFAVALAAPRADPVYPRKESTLLKSSTNETFTAFARRSAASRDRLDSPRSTLPRKLRDTFAL